MGRVIYILLYVNNKLIDSKNIGEIEKFKGLLSRELEIKDPGHAKRIVGIDIVRNRVVGTLFISSGGHVLKVLDMFGMINSKSIQTL